MNNTLICECGGTKAEWRFIVDNIIKNSISTNGFNPNISKLSSLEIILQQVKDIIEVADIQAICYYGAGISTQKPSLEIQNYLANNFPNCKHIEVKTDLLAAARATAGNQKSIICILGTGSNSCYYDGETILKSYGGHGYLLNDEGSGFDLGKKLIDGLLNDYFTLEIKELFESHYQTNLYQLREQLYKHTKVNSYLASFTYFIAKYIDYIELEQLVYLSFKTFISKYIPKYENYQTQLINFIGSVAFNFREILINVCNEFHLNLGDIIASPIDKLTQYHISKSQQFTND